jgi:hypothetical protein
VFGEGIRHRSKLREEPGCRRSRDEVAHSALDPPIDQQSSRTHVSHGVELPRLFPQFVSSFQPAQPANSGVSVEDIHRPELILSQGYQGPYRRLGRDVTGEGQRPAREPRHDVPDSRLYAALV